MKQVVVVPTGTSNVASVARALSRLSATVSFAENAGDIERADAVVVPGVGAFAAAAASLSERGLFNAVRERVARGAPTLLICLGMQLLTEGSEESPGAVGLSIVPGRVTRFPPSVRVPQLGWSSIQAPANARFLESGYAYFANSYALREAPRGWAAAFAHHGETYVAALERNGVLACQFHPELSGDFGARLLKRWLEEATAPANGPAARIIPCLDVRDGRVVKGVQFSALRDTGDPAERARIYEEQGADEIVLLDISATLDGRKTQRRVVEQTRAHLSIPLTVGGGIRTIDDVRRLLEAGADKVSLNTAAIADPPLIGEIAGRFGTQCTVVAVDCASGGDGLWKVFSHGGKRETELSVVQWVREAAERGAGEILLTSIDRDGTREGYDLPLLRAVSDAIRIPLIASGGAATAAHCAEALLGGADAVLGASMFHDGDTTVSAVKAALREKGVRVRL